MADLAARLPACRIPGAVPSAILGGMAGVLAAPSRGVWPSLCALAGVLLGIGLAAGWAAFRASSLRRRCVLATLAAVLAIAASWRWGREAIPGVPTDWLSFVTAVEGPTLTAPDGRSSVRVIFLDAGAAHSGTTYWTKLVAWDWLTGNRVVAEGYSDTAVRDGEVPFPLRWIDGRTFRVEFVAGRRSAERKAVVARVR